MFAECVCVEERGRDYWRRVRAKTLIMGEVDEEEMEEDSAFNDVSNAGELPGNAACRGP